MAKVYKGYCKSLKVNEFYEGYGVSFRLVYNEVLLIAVIVVLH